MIFYIFSYTHKMRTDIFCVILWLINQFINVLNHGNQFTYNLKILTSLYFDIYNFLIH